jgi:hypothetical protein
VYSWLVYPKPVLATVQFSDSPQSIYIAFTTCRSDVAKALLRRSRRKSRKRLESKIRRIHFNIGEAERTLDKGSEEQGFYPERKIYDIFEKHKPLQVGVLERCLTLIVFAPDTRILLSKDVIKSSLFCGVLPGSSLFRLVISDLTTSGSLIYYI